MYPDHYAVPEGLHIRLIGYVRWLSDGINHNVTTLWIDPEGNTYYCEDIWTPFVVAFWLGTRMSDLTACTVEEFSAHIHQIEDLLPSTTERVSVIIRFQELMVLWGFLEGSEKAFNTWAAKGGLDA